MARRVLCVLKVLGRLQSLERAHKARKQAKLMLQYMQTLVRPCSGPGEGVILSSGHLRAKIHVESALKYSEEHGCLTADFCEMKEQHLTTKMMSEIEVLSQVRQREKTPTPVFSQQIWRSQRQKTARDEKETTEDRTEWLHRWVAAKQWETESMDATHKRDPIIKTVETDTSWPYASYRSNPPWNYSQ